MVSWQDIEQAVERSRKHFAAATLLRDRVRGGHAGGSDGYAAEMALRHALQCGERELGDALSMLQLLHRGGSAFSLLSDDLRRAYLALNALRHAETLEPSSIDPRTLDAAADAAAATAERLQADFKRIRKETER